MSGIYFHIPYCKQACHYCDFHFSTSKSSMKEMQKAFGKELYLRKEELEKEPIDTIYFGGGTPSLLEPIALEKLVETIDSLCTIHPNVEITLEANPDDLSEKKLIELKNMGVNRLSVGTQSFDEKTLRFLNRAHSATEAKKSLELAKKHFSNISIDLIYGIETQTKGVFEEDFKTILQIDPEHISAYSLTIEGNNAFTKWVSQGKMKDVDEALSISHFNYLTSHLMKNGYRQYEISNFSKPGYESKHNTSYWFGKHYIGIGPSAHSFDGEKRSWNIANNHKYIDSINQNRLPHSFENLTLSDQVNEYIMTRLRTSWGCDLDEIKSKFGYDLLSNQHIIIDQYIKINSLSLDSNILTLTEQGKLLADKIASDLFLVP